jgi:hypothetical protein
MARERRRGRQDEAEPVEEIPTVQPEQGKGHGKEKAGKKPSGGGGYPGVLPIAVGLVAAALAFAGAQVVGGGALPPDPYASLDAGGVQAARMLASLDLERWSKGFGTSVGIRKLVLDEIHRRKTEVEATGDQRDLVPFEEEVTKWRFGVPSPPNPAPKWRPGLDIFFPENDPRDQVAENVRATGLKESQRDDKDTALLGAAVLRDSAEGPVKLATNPDPWTTDLPLVWLSPSAKPVKTLGETRVYDCAVNGAPARGYWHPMRNREKEVKGQSWVLLKASSVTTFPVAQVAVVAAALALLGGVVATYLLTTGTARSLKQLAADTDAIVHGNYETRVALRGPASLQQAAKNVQKIAHAAATGAAAPPQVVVQEIVRAPVQEIAEGLATTKSFQRPDDLEIEATQKLCAEVGCDYYDVVNVDENHVGVIVADIPTRGVRSSMHMATVRALFRANYRGQLSPAETLRAVNRAFAIDLPRGTYVTAMYVVVNRQTGVLKVASAHHLPLVFWKLAKKASAKLQPEGIALGLDPGPVFDKTLSEKAIQMDKGDRIVLFTDGAINAKNATGAQYGDERFYYVVNREAPKNSAACVNFVANDVDLFHEGAPLLDDFTLVTVRKVR